MILFLMHLNPIRVLSALAALSLTPIASLADDARPSGDAVREFLRVSGAQAASGALFEEMERVTQIALRGLEHDFGHHDGGDKVLADLSRKINAIMREELAWEQLEPLYIEVYRDVFDAGEVDALIGFFTSTAGRAYVAKQPQISRRTAALLEPRTGPIMERINRAIAEAMDALGGHYHHHHHDHNNRHSHDHNHEN